MEKIKLELYTDYLICNNGFATATGLSAMIDGDISHDQMTRFLSSRPFTSKDLWEQVKPIVRQIEDEEGYLIFDDTIQEKAWTDENEIMCWHFDYCKGRTLMDSWFGSKENFAFILEKDKHFIAALKDNRLVALTEQDKKEGRFVRISQLELTDQQAVRGWLKGFPQEVLLVRRVFTNKDGSTGLL